MSDTPLQAAIRAAFNTKANQTALDSVRAELRALEGYLLNFTTDSTVAYSKSIPANSFDYAAINSYGGRSLAWNQLCDSSQSTQTKNGVTFTNNGDGSWTVNGTASADASYQISGFYKIFASHKYFISGTPAGGSLSTYYVNVNGVGQDAGGGSIINSSISSAYGCSIVSVKQGVTVNNLVFRPRVSDLTLMFGAGNEPSTVEEFRAIFPNDIPAFNAGEIKSAGVNKIVSKDSNSVEIAAKNIPQAILDLPGYGWSAGTAKNWVDWENKKYHQEVGQVDLGDLGFSYSSDLLNPRFYRNFTEAKAQTDANAKANVLSAAQVTDTANRIANTAGITNAIGMYNSSLWICDSRYTDVTAFKAAMAGVKLNYELATPIETDISALIDDNHIRVESGGSITFENALGDSYRIPVPSTVLTAQQGA